MSINVQDLLDEGFIEGVEADGVVFGGPELHGLRILDSHFKMADLSGAKLIGCGLVGVEFTGAKADDVSLAKSSLQDVTVADSRIGSAQSYGGAWVRCTIVGGKIDYLNLRGSTVTRLTLDGVVIGELDLSHAKIEGITFIEATIGKLVLTNAQVKRLNVKGSRLHGLEANPEGLKGVVMGEDQVQELAPLLAGILGIKIA